MSERALGRGRRRTDQRSRAQPEYGYGASHLASARPRYFQSAANCVFSASTFGRSLITMYGWFGCRL